MFGLGITEILVILIVALLVLGPEKLPEAARQLGKMSVQLRRALEDLKHDISYGNSQVHTSHRREHSIEASCCPEEESAKDDSPLEDEEDID